MRVLAWISVLLAGALVATAQTEPITLTLGENRTGEISADGTARIILQVDAPGIVVVQVLALDNLLSAMRVLDTNDIEVFNAAPSIDEPILTANIALASAGDYIIELQGAFGAQFVISAGEGVVLPPPTPLIMGERLEGVIDPAAPAKVYSISAQPFHVQHLSVYSDTPNASPVIALYENDELVALVNGYLGGALLRVPRGERSYTLSILHSGSTSEIRYSLCLETEDERARCPAYQLPPPIAESTAELTPDAAPRISNCQVASNVGVLINVRAVPSLTGLIVTTLTSDASAPVVGRSQDSIWWQVEIDGVRGWVSSAVTIIAGACETIAIIEP